MLRIMKRFRFEASHRLRFHEGACRNLHGHSYVLEVYVEGEEQTEGPAKGMVVDFKALKRAAGEAEGYGLKVDTVYHTGAFMAVIEGDEIQVQRFLAALAKYLTSPSTEARHEALRRRVKFVIEAVHHWPDCQHEDVAYLKDKHRHLFHVAAAKAVDHGDRQIEIIRLRREMLAFTFKRFDRHHGTCLDLGSTSCEQLAEILIEQFGLAWCKVLEDDENGAIVMGAE